MTRDAIYFRRLIFTRNRFVKPCLAFPRHAQASNDDHCGPCIHRLDHTL